MQEDLMLIWRKLRQTSYVCIVRRSDTRRSDCSRFMKIFVYTFMKIFVYTFMKLYLYIVIWSSCEIFKFEPFVRILLTIIEIIFSIKLKWWQKLLLNCGDHISLFTFDMIGVINDHIYCDKFFLVNFY